MAKNKKILFLLFGLLHFYAFAQVQRQNNNCSLPIGNYIATEIPEEEWQLEVKPDELIETIQNNKTQIISTYTKDVFSDCRFRSIVKNIIGEDDEDVKIGERFVITILENHQNTIEVKIENYKFGVFLTLLKK